MSDVSVDNYRALLIPDGRLTYAAGYAASLSTLTQAGPLPGVPEPAQATHMTLAASGEQLTDTTYTVRCTRAGMPLPGSGAAFVWRESASPTDEYRGWDYPNVLAAWEAIDYTTTVDKWRHLHAVTLADGTVLLAVMEVDRYIRCYGRSPTTGAWSVQQVYDLGSTSTINNCPTLAVLPSGRVACIFWVLNGTSLQLRLFISDDDGTTWTQGNKALLSAPLSSSTYSPQRLRLAVRADGQALLVGWMVIAGTMDDVLLQWASSDLCSTFSLVDEQTGDDGTQGGAYPDVIVDDTTFYVACLQETAAASGDGRPYIRRLGSAYHPLSAAARSLCQESTDTAVWGDIVAGAFTTGALAIALDEDGVIYAFGLNKDDNSEGQIRRSLDGGVTWKDIGDGAWWDGNDAATFPKNFCVARQGGRMVLLHQFAADPGTADASLCVAYLGGYTTVEMPLTSEARGHLDRQGWTRTWLPFDLPDNGLFTLATSGAPTITLDTSSGALKVVHAGGGDATTYTATTAPTGTVAEGLLVLLDVRVTAGNSGDAFVSVRVGEAGPSSYEVRVTVSATSIVLRDLIAGADIATVATTIATTERVQVLIAIDNPSGAPGNDGRVKAWYSKDICDPERVWTEIGSSATLQQGASTTHRIQWGVTAGASTCYFREVAYAYDEFAGIGLYDQANWNSLCGRGFGSGPVELVSGLRIAATSGPAMRGDEWTIATRYQYGVENVHPEVSPSPRKTWRSVDDNADVELVWELSSTVGQVSMPLGASIGLYLGNINFKSFELYGRTAGNTWTLIGTGTAALGTSLRYVRSGGVVRVDSSGSTTMADYLPYNILAGSRFNLSGAVRLIDTNSEGAWNNATTKRPTLSLGADWSPLDASSGTDGEIWSKEALLLRNDITTYSAYKLKIPTQSTGEGYFQVGVVVLGHVAFLAHPYQWDRKQSWIPNTALATSISGSRRARNQGPTRRVVSFTWQDVHTSGMWDTTPAPDYVLAVTAGTPVGTPSDTPYVVAGIVEYLQGSALPLVYVPRLPKQSSSSADVTMCSRSRMLYCRATVDAVEFSTSLGDELVGAGQGEMVTGLAMTLEEEL